MLKWPILTESHMAIGGSANLSRCKALPTAEHRLTSKTHSFECSEADSGLLGRKLTFLNCLVLGVALEEQSACHLGLFCGSLQLTISLKAVCWHFPPKTRIAGGAALLKRAPTRPLPRATPLSRRDPREG